MTTKYIGINYVVNIINVVICFWEIPYFLSGELTDIGINQGYRTTRGRYLKCPPQIIPILSE